MKMKNWLKRILLYPSAAGLDLDSPQATRVHARLIREKAFLNQLYKKYYGEFTKACDLSPPGLHLEIGAGGGFLKEINPQTVTLDLRPGAQVDIIASATDIPLASGSAGAVFMLNVLHHLPDPTQFFGELTRVLTPGGRAVIIEPYVSALSKIIYKNLHHEPFEIHSPDWSLPAAGPMSSANGALPWIIFIRERARFEAEFPLLRIHRITPHTVLLYLLSGGVSMRSMAPGAAFKPLAALESSLGKAMRHLASMMTVEIVRTV